MRPFVIFFTPHSGESHLARLLGAQPDIGFQSRVFSRDTLPGGDEPQTSNNRTLFIESFWSIYRKQRNPRRARGISVGIQNRTRDLAADEPVVGAMAAFDPAIVVIRRDNIVHQALTQLGFAPRPRQRKGPKPKPIAREEYDRAMAEIRQGYTMLDRMLDRFGPVLEIAFEELVDDPEATVKLVLAHVGADPAAYVAAEDAPPLADLPAIDTLLTNPGDLRGWLSGTDFEGMV